MSACRSNAQFFHLTLVQNTDAASGRPLSSDTGTRACPACRGWVRNVKITIHPFPKHHSMGITVTLNTGNNMFCPVPLRHEKCYFKELFFPPLCPSREPRAPLLVLLPKRSDPQRPPQPPVPVLSGWPDDGAEPSPPPLCKQTLPMPDP